MKELMKEYDLDIDDIRWYKSLITAQELLSYSENVEELVQLIWSGNLATRLYDMEEQYVAELQGQIELGTLDESGAREILADAYALKNRRSWKE